MFWLAVAMATEFQLASAASVMLLIEPPTVTPVLTKYAVPSSLLWTGAEATVFKLAVLTVAVGALRSRSKVGPLALRVLPAWSYKVTLTVPPAVMAACSSALVGVPSLVV